MKRVIVFAVLESGDFIGYSSIVFFYGKKYGFVEDEKIRVFETKKAAKQHGKDFIQKLIDEKDGK